MSDAALAGLVVAYAAVLAAGSWLAERLPGRRRGPVSPWAREEAVRFRKGMARVVRLVAAFLLLAVLVRLRDAPAAVPALLLLVALGAADVVAARRTV
jgi:NhaP-type Na+/H+ and K+/H+ antiporter